MLARSLALSLLVTLGAFPARAQQETAPISPYGPAAYYKYQEAGDLTIKVQTWGNVRFPGLHEVARETRLSRLLSLAGGPALEERRRQDRRRVVLQLYRPGQNAGAPIFEQTMTGGVVNLTDDPLLLEGDVLTVDIVTKEGTTWRDYVPVITSAASVVLGITSVIVTAISLSNRN